MWRSFGCPFLFGHVPTNREDAHNLPSSIDRSARDEQFHPGPGPGDERGLKVRGNPLQCLQKVCRVIANRSGVHSCTNDIRRNSAAEYPLSRSAPD